MMESAVTLLPEPDSPTIATVSFAATSNDTLRTTGIHRLSRMNDVVSSETDRAGPSPDTFSAGIVSAPAVGWSSRFAPMLIRELSKHLEQADRRQRPAVDEA